MGTDLPLFERDSHVALIFFEFQTPDAAKELKVSLPQFLALSEPDRLAFGERDVSMSRTSFAHPSVSDAHSELVEPAPRFFPPVSNVRRSQQFVYRRRSRRSASAAPAAGAVSAARRRTGIGFELFEAFFMFVEDVSVVVEPSIQSAYRCAVIRGRRIIASSQCEDPPSLAGNHERQASFGEAGAVTEPKNADSTAPALRSRLSNGARPTRSWCCRSS